jgi:DNA-directed RNA polymerase specialized sigma24 family protein
VMAFGIHRCASSEDVADLVADTFLAAFRAAGRYRAETATAAPWLLGIATRLASNQHRTLARARRRLRERLPSADASAGLAAPDPEVSSHDH